MRWPVRPAFAWLPDWPGAFLAVCATGKDDRDWLTHAPSGDDFGDDPPAAPPPATEALLRRLAEGPVPRLVVIDVENGTAHPLRPDEILGEPSYQSAMRVAVTGDGRTAALLSSSSVLHAFDLAVSATAR